MAFLAASSSDEMEDASDMVHQPARISGPSVFRERNNSVCPKERNGKGNRTTRGPRLEERNVPDFAEPCL